MKGWELVALAFVALFLLHRGVIFVFDLIDYLHARSRRVRAEAESANRERETSGS